MPRTPVLSFTDRGLFCAAGDFYVDPWKPVDRALITHGHSDHARPGHCRYLTVASGAAVLRLRLGEIALQTVSYGERLKIGDATVSFHPAGHVPGSAQIRVEIAGEVWVVSGDYKTEPDGLSEPFEPVHCHTFISECTFGLPVFRWAPQAEVMADINHWWRANRDEGRVSVIGAYALGKAQRILAHLDPAIGPILTHGAVENVNAALRASGLALPPTMLVMPATTAASAKGAIILAPPSALGSPWARRFGPSAEAFASGWMRLRGVRRRRGLGKGFILSDHADWGGLNAAIAATGAERVFVTHGYTQPFRRWLAEQGYDAGIVETGFGGDEEEAVP
ncbi:MAG TPA: ligase-associated DNA damage response exonuclease [Albidovulum sp.]|uniref:ligase-associated DNA damage response exonuclease n=1 Tax=Albidovulum sp. TaxID=1872424 RepID=UPI002C28ED07|nr:ligase-associated DNA damage response exonuclease [Albidovulum sp.]